MSGKLPFTTRKCLEHWEEGLYLCRACRGRTSWTSSAAESMFFCLQHVESGVGTYRQKHLNSVVFPSWHISGGVYVYGFFLSFLFSLMRVRIVLNTLAVNSPDIFLLFLHGVTLTFSGHFTKGLAGNMTWTFAFSHTSFLESFRKMSGFQCMSESNLC